MRENLYSRTFSLFCLMWLPWVRSRSERHLLRSLIWKFQFLIMLINLPINLATVDQTPLTKDKHLQELIIRAVIAYRNKNEGEYGQWWHKYASKHTSLIHRHFVLINYLKHILNCEAEYSHVFNGINRSMIEFKKPLCNHYATKGQND